MLFCQCALSLTASRNRPAPLPLSVAFLPAKKTGPAAPTRPTRAPNGCPSHKFDLYAGDPGTFKPSASDAQLSVSHDSLTNPRVTMLTFEPSVNATPVSRYSI